MDDLKDKSISVNYIELLEKWLKTNGVDKKDVCLVGSSALAARGIRENHDLEFVIRPKIRRRLNCEIKRYFLWLTYNIEVDKEVELWKNQLFRIGVTDQRIFSEKLYDVIDGYNVLYVDIERLYKLEMGREKDFIDIKRIDGFAHEIKYKRKVLDRVCRRIFYVLEIVEFYLYSKWSSIGPKFIHRGDKDQNVRIILWFLHSKA